VAAGEPGKITRQRVGRMDDGGLSRPTENDLTCLAPLTDKGLIIQQYTRDIDHEFNIEPPPP
jgi:hypothetical protein